MLQIKKKSAAIKKGETDGITVSGDGTWRKRFGFSSLFGIVTLIGFCFDKIVDYVIKSKYCKSCEYWNKMTGTEEYAEWAETHAAECQANHEGSAGKMEVVAAVEMFQRSQELHNVKYANYIRDGDSKTFKGITDAKPFSDITPKKKSIMFRSVWVLVYAT